MVQIIKFILFIKTFELVLITWLCYFNIDMRTFNKFADAKYKHGRNLDPITLRLLAKYKQDKDSHILGLKQNKSNNNEHEKYNITINEKGNKKKNKKSDKSSLNKAQYYMEVIDYNNGMFDGKHFHFEKKWIKKKDYDNFLKKNRTICDISLRKIRFRKYGIGVAIFVIFSLCAAAIDVLPRLPFLNTAWEKLEEGNILKTLYDYVNNWDATLKTSIYLTLYSVLMLILIIVLVIGICRVLGNNEKYNKIKLMSEQSAY
ncbi:fam-m protein [Plasmodium malariae]|uniref:Fam-m protein n=1 Tax=Plasmodium malariae TaxID=5858 RepID=A0A1D3JHQ3_PLAMA|nr:fam-m protein [Plasmodium malariae]SBT85816.1 fam-m protein [Plasmodium malariae]